MRVIAGTARGTTLFVPKGLEVRPTLDRVRESLFSILGPDFEGARFLDLFAGTGANGIEALSRGAAGAVFVDNDLRHIQAIERNLGAAKVAVRAEVLRLTLPQGLRTLRGRAFGFIFADPPYAFTEYHMLIETIKDMELLVPQGVLVVEHASKGTKAGIFGAFSPYRVSVYGETSLSFFS